MGASTAVVALRLALCSQPTRGCVFFPLPNATGRPCALSASVACKTAAALVVHLLSQLSFKVVEGVCSRLLDANHTDPCGQLRPIPHVWLYQSLSPNLLSRFDPVNVT